MRRLLYEVRCIQSLDALFDVDERGGLWSDPYSLGFTLHIGLNLAIDYLSR